MFLFCVDCPAFIFYIFSFITRPGCLTTSTSLQSIFVTFLVWLTISCPPPSPFMVMDALFYFFFPNIIIFVCLFVFSIPFCLFLKGNQPMPCSRFTLLVGPKMARQNVNRFWFWRRNALHVKEFKKINKIFIFRFASSVVADCVRWWPICSSHYCKSLL